jgi:hypothetical protein
MIRRCAAATLLCSGCLLAKSAAATDCFLEDRWGWAAPDHARLQTGGYLGALIVGVGYTAFHALELDTYYGWVPSNLGGKNIHTIALRVSGHLPGWCLTRQLRWTWLYFGIGGLHTFGRGFFVRSPDPFPPRYYPVTATRPFFGVGRELTLLTSPTAPLTSHGVFAEANAQDQYAFEWLDNTSQIQPWEVWSLAFGYKASF